MVKLRIFEACKIGDLERVQSDAAVQQDLVDPNGASCLHYAARGGSIEIVKYLVKSAGFDPLHRSNTGSTALHDAAARGNTVIVKWLVEECAMNVDDQDGVGITALHLSARYRHPLTVEWLLDEACADESIRTGSGAIPLFFAVVGGDLNCVKILMDENPRLVNMQLNNGATPLYIACQNGLLEIAQYLHGRNGATKIKAYDGMSCLHAAAQLGYLDLVKWLVQVGECNPNDRDFDGATPLHYAASRGHTEIVWWLLSLGGARVTLDNLGGSPLHSAAEMGELQAVQALLDTGCDVTLVDNQGLTAAELAEKCDQSEAAALIRGEITLDQLEDENRFTVQELTVERPSQLPSPRLTFPPPPPFPPEEEPEEEYLAGDPATTTTTTATTTTAASSYRNHNQSQPQEPSVLYQTSLDSPSSFPSPPPPVLHDSPVRGKGRGSSPSPPLPPAPPSEAPPCSHSYSALAGVEPQEEVVAGSEAGIPSQDRPVVRSIASRASVNSSASDLGAFEITTVQADVHKSRGSIESVSTGTPQGVAVPAIRTVTNSVYIITNTVAVTSNSPAADSSQQFRRFCVLKHVPQNTGIQEEERVELENSSITATTFSSNNHNYHSGTTTSNLSTGRCAVAVSPVSKRQRSPSPPLPAPPPLSPGSESFDSEDASLSASTSCSNLPPQDTDLPPPPSEIIQAQSSSLYEEPPPPPPQPGEASWQAVSSSEEFPAPPSSARLAITSRHKLNSLAQDHTQSAVSTSNFKEYFDSGTRANFARARALFGAFGDSHSEASTVKSSAPSRTSQGCVNPDSGETESDCRGLKRKSLVSGTSTKRGSQEIPSGLSPIDKLVMDPATQSTTNGQLSPALSTQSGHSAESSLSRDSVRSSVNDQGGHVTIISTSGGSNGVSSSGEGNQGGESDAPGHAKKTENQPQPSSQTHQEVVRAAAQSAISNGLVVRGGNGEGSGRAAGRMVVSAGPETLTKPHTLNGQQAQSSPSSSETASPVVIKKNKHDLIADIQSAVSGTSNLSLRRAKSRGEGVSMVYSSKRHSTGQDQSKMTDTTKPLTGDFDPKNFLDQVETVDATGRTIPEWRRHVLAKHAAEKAQKEFEEKRVVEDYESRFKDMPAWKRALIERREAQAREEEAASKK